jgi:hypothetical protein
MATLPARVTEYQNTEQESFEPALSWKRVFACQKSSASGRNGRKTERGNVCADLEHHGQRDENEGRLHKSKMVYIHVS